MRSLNVWEEEVGKVKWAEVVDGHCHLYSHFVDLSVIHNHACVVHKDINGLELLADKFGELFNGGAFGEV
jgi:hypothetical protein